MSANPFAALIINAKAREADLATQATADALRNARIAAEKRSAAEKEAQLNRLLDFGRGFLHAVAQRVVRPGWSSEYISQIETFCAALLRGRPSELPKIGHAQAILDKFEYGLMLFKRHHGYPVPEGTFYGQQLLAERDAARAASAKPERIKIAPGVKPKAECPERPATNVVELRPATTPKGVGKKSRRHRPA